MNGNPYDTPKANVANQASSPSASSSFFGRCWRGEARLWQAFWILLVLGYPALHFLIAFVITRLIPLGGPSRTVFSLVVLALGAAQLGFFVFACVSVWRCAPNTAFPRLRAVARLVLAIIIAVLVLAFIHNLLEDVPRLMEEPRSQQSSQPLTIIAADPCGRASSARTGR